MKTFVVWLLLVNGPGGVQKIETFGSKADCIALTQQVGRLQGNSGYVTCAPATVVRP